MRASVIAFAIAAAAAQQITIYPPAATVVPGSQIPFTYSTAGATDPFPVKSLAWSVQGPAGVATITSNGLLTVNTTAAVGASFNVKLSATTASGGVVLTTAPVTVIAAPATAATAVITGVNVTTLPAGATATASYANGVLQLGIPAGPPGTAAPPPFTSVSVTTLPAGSPATSAIANGVLQLGIPAGAPGASSPAASGPPWKYGETPISAYPSPPPYGTGFALKTICPIVPGTVHMYVHGNRYREGADFYVGSITVNATTSTLPSKAMLAALNFNLGAYGGVDALDCTQGQPCTPVQVDYQYTPDGSSSCP